MHPLMPVFVCVEPQVFTTASLIVVDCCAERQHHQDQNLSAMSVKRQIRTHTQKTVPLRSKLLVLFSVKDLEANSH